MWQKFTTHPTQVNSGGSNEQSYQWETKIWWWIRSICIKVSHKIKSDKVWKSRHWPILLNFQLLRLINFSFNYPYPWPRQMFLVYVPAQILGGLFGFGLLSVSIPWSHYSEKSSAGICMTLPLEGMETGTAFICEFCFTAILILVCCGLWDRRSGHLQDSGAIKFGLTIAALSMAGGQLTGASMNPARSLAPAVWQGNLSFQWLYWVTPMVSSLVTTLFYRFVLSENKKTD